MAIRFLSETVTIRVNGGLQGLTIRADQPLPLNGEVSVKDQVQIAGDAPLTIRDPITVREIKAPVQAHVTVKDQLRIAVKDQLNVDGQVRIEGPVKVSGDVEAEVKPRLSPLGASSLGQQPEKKAGVSLGPPCGFSQMNW